LEVDIYQIPNPMTDEDWSRAKTGLKPNYHIASIAQLPGGIGSAGDRTHDHVSMFWVRCFARH
jgi:hypothetical protein